MVDAIFVVEDPTQWHAENMTMHPEHYSSFAKLGAAAVATLQSLPAGLYFNTSVPLPGTQHTPPPPQLLKYGVISLSQLLVDLCTWRWLYAAGRLHKPVRFLQPPPPVLAGALQANIASASAAALLLLPSVFPLGALLHTVAGLSYTGDFRMAIGENPHKVANIVTRNAHHFSKLFLGSSHQVQALSGMGLVLPGGRLPQGASADLAAAVAFNQREVGCTHTPQSTDEAFLMLPRPFQHRVLHTAGVPHEDVSASLAQRLPLPARPRLARALQRTITATVAPAAALQSVKGILTAGPGKSAAYALAKLQKQARGLLRR